METPTQISYIAESGEFIINGRVIKENTLTEDEKIHYKIKAKNTQILTGANTKPIQNILFN